ncbi:MAG TPA: hypothetical protein VKD90_02995 [Gemmataceae bacterium]|nr:hypothetical protein [Gemmataceae bacterium]
MPPRTRRLSVESFEDRFLPSAAIVLLSPTSLTGTHRVMTDNESGRSAGDGAPASTGIPAWAILRGHGRFGESREDVQVTVFARVIVWIDRDFLTSNRVSEVRPVEPVQYARAAAQSSATTSDTPEAAARPTPQASSPGPVAARGGPGLVALAPTNNQAPAAQADAGRAQATDSDRAQVNVGPSGAVLTGPVAVARTGVFFGQPIDPVATEAGGTTVAPAAPSQTPEPPTAPEPGPAPEAPTTITNLPGAVPLAGILPFNFPVFEAAADQFLDAVSDLTANLTDDSAGTQEYLWIGAATLLAAGAVRTAIASRARPVRRTSIGLDSGLAEWEGRNAG